MNFKKIVCLVGFLAMTFFILNFSLPQVKAYTDYTAEELQQMIQELQRQIAELRAKLSELRPEPLWCHDFTVNLGVGDRGSEVNALVVALTKEGFITAEERGLHDIYEFNERVASAVVSFQEKYANDILAPLGLIRGTGYVGPSTRAKLNSIYGCEVIPPETCDQKCKSLGYQLGVCKTFAVSPGGFEQKEETEKTYTSIGWTADCHNRELLVGITRSCYCYPKEVIEPSIIIISPREGQKIPGGTTYNVRWESRGLTKEHQIFFHSPHIIGPFPEPIPIPEPIPFPEIFPDLKIEELSSELKAVLSPPLLPPVELPYDATSYDWRVPNVINITEVSLFVTVHKEGQVPAFDRVRVEIIPKLIEEVTCWESTGNFNSGCDLLVNYDRNNDGIIDEIEALIASLEHAMGKITKAELDFIQECRQDKFGRIDSMCEGCWAGMRYNLTVRSLPEPGINISSITGHSGMTTYNIPGIRKGTRVSLTAPLMHGNYLFQGWDGCYTLLDLKEIDIGDLTPLLGDKEASIDDLSPLIEELKIDIAPVSTTCNLIINSDQAVTARYVEIIIPPTFSVTSTPVTGVNISSATGHSGITNYMRFVSPGTLIYLNAPSSHDNRAFSHWSGCVTSTNRTISLRMPSSNTVCRANYEGTTPSITVISPRGGEQWQITRAYDIIWDAQGVRAVNIDLENWEGFSPGGPLTWRLATNLPVISGKYSWTISENMQPKVTPGNYYRIRITDAYDYSSYAQQTAGSSSHFSIVAPPDKCVRANPTVAIYPEARSFKPGDSYDYSISIRNNDPSICGPSEFDVSAACSSQLECEMPTEIIPVTISPDQSYAVTIRVRSFKDTPPGNYRISAIATNWRAKNYVGMGEGIYVVEPPDKCVRANPTVAIYPEARSFKPGDSYDYSISIRNNDPSVCGSSEFDVSAACSSQLDCEIFTKMPVTISPDQSYAVTIRVRSFKDTPPGNYRISAIATNWRAKNYVGMGEGIYVVETEKSITVISPNGGELWQMGKTYPITWRSEGISRVNIAACRSEDDFSCVRIGPSEGVDASVGRYTWTIMRLLGFVEAGSSLKIRITDYNDSAVRDFSDDYFNVVGEKLEYALSVTSNPITGVFISSDTGHYGITNYGKYVLPETMVTLSAPSTYGSYGFSYWSGCVTSTNQNIRLLMPSSDVFCRANFSPISPPAPTNLRCTTVSSSQINLYWTASTEGSYYRVYRCTGSICTPNTIVQTTSNAWWNNTNLAANTTYRYCIRAYNAAGESSCSNIVNCSTQSADGPFIIMENTDLKNLGTQLASLTEVVSRLMAQVAKLIER